MLDRTALKLSLLAVAASLLFSFVLYPIIEKREGLVEDPDRYGEIGFNISRGDGFVHSHSRGEALERGPLYPYALAILFSISGGYSVVAVQIFQAILHGVTAYLVFLIGCQLYDRRLALLPQVLFAVHPFVLWYTARIWVETSFTLLVCAVALTTLLMFDRPTFRNSLICGVMIGLSCLAKAVLLLLPLVFVVPLVKRSPRAGLKTVASVVLGMIIIIAPWTIRNYSITGTILPVHASLGFNLIQGDIIGEQWPSRLCCTLDFWVAAFERTESILSPEGDQWESMAGDRKLIEVSIGGMIEQPVQFLGRAIANFCTLWYLSESPLKSTVVGFLQVPLLITAFMSLVFYREKMTDIAPLLAIAGYYIVVHVLVVGWGRYSMPLAPLMFIMAAPLLSDLLGRRSG